MRRFLKIELSASEKAELDRKYTRGMAARIAKHVLFNLEMELPRNNFAVQSRRELNAHLARIGSNINQISKAVNQAALADRITPDMALKLQALLLDIFTQLESFDPSHDDHVL